MSHFCSQDVRLFSSLCMRVVKVSSSKDRVSRVMSSAYCIRSESGCRTSGIS